MVMSTEALRNARVSKKRIVLT